MKGIGQNLISALFVIALILLLMVFVTGTILFSMPEQKVEKKTTAQVIIPETHLSLDSYMPVEESYEESYITPDPYESIIELKQERSSNRRRSSSRSRDNSCDSNFVCDEWSSCADFKETRKCKDLNFCTAEKTESRDCEMIKAPEYNEGTYWRSFKDGQLFVTHVAEVKKDSYEMNYQTPDSQGYAEVSKDQLKFIKFHENGAETDVSMDLLNFPLIPGKKWSSKWTFEGADPVDIDFEVVGVEAFDYVKNRQLATENNAYKIKATIDAEDRFFHYVAAEGDFPGSSIIDMLEEMETGISPIVMSTGVSLCEDTDSGDIPEVKGSVTGLKREQYVPSVYQDKCIDSSEINELFCERNLVKEKVHQCSLGCGDGACCAVSEDRQCFKGDVYTFDTCGNEIDVFEDCGGYGCTNAQCNPKEFITYPHKLYTESTSSTQSRLTSLILLEQTIKNERPSYQIAVISEEGQIVYNVAKDDLQFLSRIGADGKETVFEINLLDYPLYVGKNWDTDWIVESSDGTIVEQEIEFEVIGQEEYDYVVAKDYPTEDTAFIIEATVEDGPKKTFHYVAPYEDFHGSNLGDVLTEFLTGQKYYLLLEERLGCADPDEILFGREGSYYLKSDSSGWISNAYIAATDICIVNNEEVEVCKGEDCFLSELTCYGDYLERVEYQCVNGCNKGACVLFDPKVIT
jgi:hypothetical protein